MVESSLSKEREIFAFCSSVEKFNSCMVFSEKWPLLEISRGPILTGVAGLQYTVFSAIKGELPTKFLKGALNLKGNFQEVVSNGIPYQKLTDLQTAAFSITCFKTPEITSTG